LPFIAGAEEAAVGSYAISAVSFKVEGRTTEAALKRALEADGKFEGQSFATKEELEAFVAERRQALANNRVLGSVESEIEYAERLGGGSFAAVSFAVVDTHNLIVLPEPKYDSNAGLSLTLKGRDYDFLGSMQTLELDVGYTSEAVDNRYFNAQTNFVLPFHALGADFSAGFLEDAALWTDGSLKSATAASLAYEIPGLGFPARLKAIGGFYYNDDLADLRSGVLASDEADPAYLSASGIASAKIPTGLRLGALGELRITPKLTFNESWWPGLSLEYPKREGASIEAKAKLEAGRIDWEGNFQSGAAAKAIATGTEYLSLVDFVGEAELSFEEHWAFAGRWGIAARVVGLGRPLGSFPGDDLTDLGVYLRGIVDERIASRGGAFVSLAVPVKLFDFPTHAIIGKDILDFELQATPFVDAAYILGASDAAADGPWASAGLELLVFPKAFRSFILRASIGYDLSRAASAGSFGAYEIYIGTGLFLDPIQTTREEWAEK
jgi:hypothetical protein